MANYIGVRCPVCNKKFSQTDDIVVCPVCGAPHHRDCYANNNECAFVSGHLSGNVWRAPSDQKVSGEGASESRSCASCGRKAPEDALFCQTCGLRLDNAPQQGKVGPNPQEWGLPGIDFIRDPLYTVYGGVNPEEEIDDLPVKDIAKYIGGSSSYYLPRFQNMSRSGKTISINLAALFFNFFYFFYRKMYLTGIVLLGLYAVSVIPSFLYTWEALPVMMHQMGFAAAFEQAGMSIPSLDQVDMAAIEHYLNLSGLTQLIYIFIGIIFSVCANNLYYRKCIREVKKLRSLCGEEGLKEQAARERYDISLTQTGGTSKMAPILTGVGMAVMYFALSAIMISIVLGG